MPVVNMAVCDFPFCARLYGGCHAGCHGREHEALGEDGGLRSPSPVGEEMWNAGEIVAWNAAIDLAATVLDHSAFTYVGTCEAGLVASGGGQAATKICANAVRALKRQSGEG